MDLWEGDATQPITTSKYTSKICILYCMYISINQKENKTENKDQS